MPASMVVVAARCADQSAGVGQAVEQMPDKEMLQDIIKRKLVGIVARTNGVPMSDPPSDRSTLFLSG